MREFEQNKFYSPDFDSGGSNRVSNPNNLPVPIVGRTAIAAEISVVLNKVVDVVPERTLQDMVGMLDGRLDVTRSQLQDFATTVVEFRDGVQIAPTALDFLSSPTQFVSKDDKVVLSVRSLRSIISHAVVAEQTGKTTEAGLNYRIGRATHELLFYVGDNDVDIVNDALDGLTIVERTFLLKSMSTALLEKLGYPDLDDCDEARMADYIRNSSYLPQDKRIDGIERRVIDEEKMDNLCIFLETCMSRDSRNIDVQEVISMISELPNADLIYRNLIRMANAGEYLDTLQWFFQRDTTTAQYAKECDRVLNNTFREIE
jgi:hypothetical protein